MLMFRRHLVKKRTINFSCAPSFASGSERVFQRGRAHLLGQIARNVTQSVQHLFRVIFATKEHHSPAGNWRRKPRPLGVTGRVLLCPCLALPCPATPRRDELL